MNRKEVHDHVIGCLRNLTTNEITEAINETTNPMMKLGLDSHDGVNLACLLSAEFSCEIPNNINPLVDDQRNRPRLVGEIVDLVCKLMVARREQPNG
jgi:acyl carrier protein